LDWFIFDFRGVLYEEKQNFGISVDWVADGWRVDFGGVRRRL
jgi:hypothetical protein